MNGVDGCAAHCGNSGLFNYNSEQNKCNCNVNCAEASYAINIPLLTFGSVSVFDLI